MPSQAADFGSTEGDFNYVDAQYREDGLLPEHVGNAYIKALPAIPEDRELARALTYLPPFSPSERELPAAMRIQLVGKLSKLFVAVPRVVNIARAMLCMLHQGYEDRAPGSQADRDTRRELYAKQQAGDFASAKPLTGNRQLSLSLVGSSGGGKTYTIENVCAKLPRVIYHPAIGRWQVPFAFVEMSHDGKSSHSLATQLAEYFDQLMPDGRFVDTFIRKGRANAEERLFHVLRAAYEHGLGMLIVDESQNQRSTAGEEPTNQRRKSRGTAVETETPLMKLLITASNRAKVPLMFVGTTELSDVVSTRFTKARRTSGNGSACWLPFKRAPKGEIAEFELILKTLFRYQWTPQVATYGEGWAELFFEHSQGITDILVKLWRATQVLAISTNKDCMTVELVKEAFDLEFMNVKTGLTALKNKDRLMLEYVSDLLPPEVDVERLSTAEFGAPARAVPLGQPMRTHQVASEHPVGARAASGIELGAGGKSAPKRARTNTRKEPASPKAIEIDPAVAAAGDLRGIKPESLDVEGASPLALARFGQTPGAASAGAAA